MISFYSFQVGSGLNGTLFGSYVEYNASLVDRCVYYLSPGCNFTITFWLKIPTESISSIILLISPNGDSTAGVRVSMLREGERRAIGFSLASCCEHGIIRSLSVLEFETWYHIAFTSQNTTHLALYIDFVESPISQHFFRRSQEIPPAPFSEAYMASGSSRSGPPFGFNIIDELVMFSEILSPEEIMQLQN